LKQALNRYGAYFRAAKTHPIDADIQATLKADMERLSLTLGKLDSQVARIAVFGLVSRGKSAILNALMGEDILPTGPIHGITQTARSLFWLPIADLKTGARPSPSALAKHPSPSPSSLTIELIDTPGLDEIDGQVRAQMAQDIAQQSDLILFIVSGDMTRTEYEAICELRQAQKPLLLVFNKIDLYPTQTQQAIYQNLQQLAAKSKGGEALQQLLSADEVVLVAANPAPLQVRVEHPDGCVTEEWETPPVQIEDLKRKILQVLQQEGRTLLALNALLQVQDAEKKLASQLLEVHNAEAEELIWKFTRYKAIAVALNPIAFLDLCGGFLSDLAMIRALSELYGLPVTRYEAGKLWKTILLSSGSLLLSEVGSGLVLGLGKTAAAAAAGVDSATSLPAYAGTAVVQGAIAGFGTYTVGRAIQTYLENGCSWGSQGANTIIQEILNQLEPNTIIFRLRQELSQQLGFPET
jgi:small GTP-binding protein